MSDKFTGQWRKCTGNGTVPVGRSSQSLSVVGRRIYVFGGENTPRVPLDNFLHVYDLDEEIWSKCDTTGDPPCPRIAHASAVVDSFIYIFGGRTGVGMGEGSLNDMHRFHTVNKTWERVDCSGEKPSTRSFHAMTTWKHNIYVFGGCSPSGRLNDLHVFDTKATHWSALPSYDIILPRGGPGFVNVGDRLYVVAGFTGDEADDMYCYDILSATWSEIKPEPNLPCISVFGIAAVGSSILLHGGEVSPSDQGHEGAGQYSDTTYVYDTTSEKSEWRVVSVRGETPPPRGWHAAAPVQSGVAVHGGNSPDNVRRDDLYVLIVDV